jgi:hypothetical protein
MDRILDIGISGDTIRNSGNNFGHVPEIPCPRNSDYPVNPVHPVKVLFIPA